MAVVNVEEEAPDTRRRVLLVVGVLGLFAAGIFAAFAIGGSSETSAGAETPQGAYEQLFESLANEDLIGAAEILLPGERDSLIQPWFDMVEQYKRLEVLDPALDLSAVPGIDLEFSDLEFETTQISEDLMSVKLVGGTAVSSVDPMKLPLGPLVLDRLPEGTIPDEIETGIGSVDPLDLNQDNGLVAVRRDGRWYVSLWYTVAEAAREQGGLSLPDPSDRIRPRGESTAELAVEEFVRSSIDLDVRRLIELLPPGEADALHDYAPLFLDDVEAAGRETRNLMGDIGLEIDLVRLDLTSIPRGPDRIVQFNGGEILFTSDYVDVGFDVTDGKVTVDAVIAQDEVRFSLTIVDDCFEFEISDLDGEIQDLQRGCASDVENMIEEFLGQEVFVGGLPEFDIFTEQPVIGIYTVERDGQWYVSPLGTLLDTQVEVLAVIDKDKLADLVDWFIVQAEENLAIL